VMNAGNLRILSMPQHTLTFYKTRHYNMTMALQVTLV